MRMINVSVVLAFPEKCLTAFLELPDGSTMGDAMLVAQADAVFADFDVGKYRVGVFGELVGLDKMLRDEDRCELYRPILEDPKAQRVARAEVQNRIKG